jgi:hypothetical protein
MRELTRPTASIVSNDALHLRRFERQIAYAVVGQIVEARRSTRPRHTPSPAPGNTALGTRAGDRLAPLGALRPSSREHGSGALGSGCEGENCRLRVGRGAHSGAACGRVGRIYSSKSPTSPHIHKPTSWA